MPSAMCLWAIGAAAALTVSAMATPADDVQISLGEPLGRLPSSYGYAALPIVLTNSADAVRTVRLTCSGHPDWGFAPMLTRVSRTIILPPNATFAGTILRPPASLPNVGAEIWVNGTKKRESLWFGDGRFIENRTWGPSIGSSETILVGRRVPLIVSDALEDPYQVLHSDSATYRSASSRGIIPIPIDTIAVDSSWPTEWLAYSRFRLIAMTEEEWQALPGAAQSALLETVSAGLDLWIVTHADPSRFTAGFTTDVDRPDESEESAEPVASVYKDTSSSLALGAGHVTAVSPDQTPPKRLIERITRPSPVTWRTTMTDDDCERALPISSVLKVPAGPMLGILIFFAVLIGPVNIFFVSRCNRRVLLFVTTPALGLMFSVGVFAFGVSHDGTRARAITRATTILDIKGGIATTFAHTAYYAPFSPGDGLHFDDHTMVIPSMTSGGGIMDQAALTLDLTDGQHFASGLVRPRVPTHVRFVHVEPRRERLVFTKDASGAIQVQNGLGIDIRSVYYVDNTGALFATEKLPAGAHAPMETMSGVAGQPLHEAMRNLTTPDPAMTLGRAPGFHDYRNIPFGGFAALIDGSPFHRAGLTNLRKHDAASLVIGLAALETP